jgi:hypothetical protein
MTNNQNELSDIQNKTFNRINANKNKQLNAKPKQTTKQALKDCGVDSI